MNSPFKRPDIDLTGMASMTAAVVAREFLLISRFIPPPQFVLELWSAMADSLGVKVHQTTAYHPQTNGMCKQLHESLKAALWGSLTGLRCAVREDLWDSPAELVLGQPLRDPGEFMPASPPPLRVSIPLCCLSVPPETRFPFLVHHCLPDPIVLFDGPFRVIQPGRKPFLFGLWKSAGGCSY